MNTHLREFPLRCGEEYLEGCREVRRPFDLSLTVRQGRWTNPSATLNITVYFMSAKIAQLCCFIFIWGVGGRWSRFQFLCHFRQFPSWPVWVGVREDSDELQLCLFSRIFFSYNKKIYTLKKKKKKKIFCLCVKVTLFLQPSASSFPEQFKLTQSIN